MSAPQQQKQALAQYQGVREQIDRSYAKLAQLNSDRSEHELVISQLRQLHRSTRCWHQIGAVLAEKNVAQVVPLLVHNRDKLAETATLLSDNIAQLEQSAQQLEKKYSIREPSPLTAPPS